MTHTRKNQGVCSGKTVVQLSPQGIIEKINVTHGCDGNLQAICRLLQGRAAAQAIPLLQGIRCEDRDASCPQQIAVCLEEALEKLGC